MRARRRASKPAPAGSCSTIIARIVSARTAPSFHQPGSGPMPRPQPLRPWMRALLIAVVALVALPSAAQAQVQINPGVVRQLPRIVTAPPSVVALGDSAISGEAGRWAGNTNQSPSKTDALGATAYNDIPGAESTPGCHRSK